MGGRQRHDEQGLAGAVGLGQPFLHVAEHVFVGHAPGADLRLGIALAQRLLVDELVRACWRKAQVAPGGRARGDEQHPVAALQVRREGIAGDGRTGRWPSWGCAPAAGPANRWCRCLRRRSGRSASRIPNAAAAVAPRGVERAEVMAHAFHDLQHDVGGRSRGGVQCRDSHEGFQAVARAAQEALVQQLSFALRHRCKALVVIAVGQGPGKGRDAVGRDVVEQRDRRQIGVVLVQGNLLIEPRQASTVMPMISSSRSAQARTERGFGKARSSRARHFAVSHHVAASTADNSRRAARIALPHGAQDGRGVFVDQAEHEDVDRTGKGGVVKR